MATKKYWVGTLVAAAVYTIFSSMVLANTVRCEFNDWRGSGSKEDVVVSWVGMGFEAQPSKNRVRKVYSNGVTDWMTAKVTETANFTGLVVRQTETSVSSEKIRATYNFRLHKTGKCKLILDLAGYTPFFGEGMIE